jgi:hypothetical protein
MPFSQQENLQLCLLSEVRAFQISYYEFSAALLQKFFFNPLTLPSTGYLNIELVIQSKDLNHDN